MPISTSTSIQRPASPATTSGLINDAEPMAVDPQNATIDNDSSSVADASESTHMDGDENMETNVNDEAFDDNDTEAAIAHAAAAAAAAAAALEAKEKSKLEKKERHATKKLMKELAVCKTMLEGMEVCHRLLLFFFFVD